MLIEGSNVEIETSPVAEVEVEQAQVTAETEIPSENLETDDTDTSQSEVDEPTAETGAS